MPFQVHQHSNVWQNILRQGVTTDLHNLKALTEVHPQNERTANILCVLTDIN